MTYNIRIYEYTNIRIYEYTNIRIYEYTNIRIYEYTNIRIYEYVIYYVLLIKLNIINDHYNIQYNNELLIIINDRLFSL